MLSNFVLIGFQIFPLSSNQPYYVIRMRNFKSALLLGPRHRSIAEGIHSKNEFHFKNLTFCIKFVLDFCVVQGCGVLVDDVCLIFHVDNFDGGRRFLGLMAQTYHGWGGSGSNTCVGRDKRMSLCNMSVFIDKFKDRATRMLTDVDRLKLQ